MNKKCTGLVLWSVKTQMKSYESWSTEILLASFFFFYRIPSRMNGAQVGLFGKKKKKKRKTERRLINYLNSYLSYSQWSLQATKDCFIRIEQEENANSSPSTNFFLFFFFLSFCGVKFNRKYKQNRTQKALLLFAI